MFAKYLNESCYVASDKHSFFEYFPKYAFVSEIFPKIVRPVFAALSCNGLRLGLGKECRVIISVDTRLLEVICVIYLASPSPTLIQTARSDTILHALQSLNELGVSLFYISLNLI